MERIRVDDLQLRPEVPQDRLARRASLRETVNASMNELDKAVSKYALDEYYGKAYDLVLSGKARDAMDLTKETDKMRERVEHDLFYIDHWSIGFDFQIMALTVFSRRAYRNAV